MSTCHRVVETVKGVLAATAPLAAAALIAVAGTAPVGLAGQGARAETSSGKVEAPTSLCPHPGARAFDFWIGEWDVLNRYRVEGRLVDAGRARVKVYPVVGGCALIEHWDGNLGERHVRGFSFRAFDPGTGEWLLVLNWPSAGNAGFGTLRGSFRHGRGEFFTPPRVNPDGDTVRTRFSFADIRGDTFRWDQSFSTGGSSWETRWIMEYSRRPDDALPVLNVPSQRASLCGDDEAVKLEALLGPWREVDAEDEPVPGGQRVDAYRILDGCAVVEFVALPDGGSVYRVTGYDTRVERWVRWSIDSERRRLLRREGTFREGTLELASTSEVDDVPPERVRWTHLGGGSARVEVARRNADGGWRTVRTVTLERGGPRLAGR